MDGKEALMNAIQKYFKYRQSLIDQYTKGDMTKREYLRKNYEAVVYGDIGPFRNMDTVEKALFNYQYYNALELQKAGAAFTRVTLTVPEGATESEVLMLKDLHNWSVADGVWTEGDGEWTWTQGGRYVFMELPLKVAEGEMVYFIGRVGSGKSTLIKFIIANIIPNIK